MTRPYSHRRIIQLVPAAPGWRTVEKVSGIAADAPLDQFFWTEPIALLAPGEEITEEMRREALDREAARKARIHPPPHDAAEEAEH